jgi:uncharacterized membrane protein YbhN (UPF0104 family)
MNKKRLSQWGTVLFSVLLLGISVWTIASELETYSIHDLLKSIQAIPLYRLALAGLLMVIGYWVTTLYDVLGLHYIHHPLPYRQAAFAAFTSYAFSNSVGFPLLTSSAIRYRLYVAWGLTALEIAQLIAFSHLSFWLGILSVGGVLFARESLVIPKLLNWSFASVEVLGRLFLGLVAGYLLVSVLSKRSFKIGHRVILLPSLKFSLAQIALSAIDWGIAGGVLYSVLLPAEPLTYPHFFAIYLLAQLAGMVSNVPGGLGVFETIVILLLAGTVSPEATFGSLLIYRGIYYWIPFGVAVFLLWFREFRQRFRGYR